MNKAEAGKLGGIARFKKHGNPMADPIVAKKSNDSKKGYKGAKASHESGRMENGQARKMGVLSRKHENEVAASLPYEEVFLPQEVCDRIAVMNGEILFIEIKQVGRPLTKKQKKFQELVGTNYIVVYK